MTAAEVTELVAAAKSFDRQTFAHASGDAGIENAVEGGVDSVEHAGGCEDERPAAHTEDLGPAVVPLKSAF